MSQLEYDSVTIPFKRGEILDANGTILAISNKVYNVILDTKVLMDDEANLEPTLNALRTVFGIDTGEVREYIVTHPNSSYYVLARRLDYEQVEKFKELQKNEENGSHIKGIWFEDEYKESIRTVLLPVMSSALQEATTRGSMVWKSIITIFYAARTAVSTDI